MTRRESLTALISGGAAYRERPQKKGARVHHQDKRLYHGPITLPAEVLDTLARSPVFRTTGKQLALRVQRDGITYLLRTALSGADYVGEVVRTQSGGYRVHAWTVSLAAGRPISEILERDREQMAREQRPAPSPPPAPPALVPPVSAPEGGESPYAHYFVTEADLAGLQMPRKITR